jgi:hypothetical protein
MEIVAYIASCFILFAFTLKDQLKLRIFNSIGAIIFIYYSLYKNDYPVVFINSSIVAINLFYIIKNTKWRKGTKNAAE